MMSGSNIAAEINAAHAAVEAAAQAGTGHAIRCGQLLSEAKATVKHGQWDAWISAHCMFSSRTAQLYMRIARQTAGDPAKAQRVADLSLRAAGQALSEPRPKSVSREPLSDEDQVQLHRLLTAWYEARPAERDRFRLMLKQAANEQGVPESRVVFGIREAGRG